MTHEEKVFHNFHLFGNDNVECNLSELGYSTGKNERISSYNSYNEIEEFGYDTFTTVANSIENHYERILNYFVNRSTNAAAEAFNAKIKAFRASFRRVVDKRFFLYRLAKVYA